MVQNSLILSAIALLGLSHMMLGGVEAAPSVDAARQLFGRVYNSHRLYNRNVLAEEGAAGANATAAGANATAAGNASCPVEINNSTLDAVSLPCI
jgi:hypothetical protein